MTEVYLGQIMMTGFGYAQKTFAMCNGQLMSIQQNAALFSLLGTYYGGNGVQTFALPDLRGRAPVGGFASVDPAWQPSPYSPGTIVGAETETLTAAQMPVHNHTFGANTAAGTLNNPTGALFGQAVIQPSGTENIYVAGGNLVPLAGQTLGLTGGSQPHPNMQPSRVINFNIALSGIYPSRN